ncbi:RidA family protein [Pelovirga terrestris]|uniref:RidA family protein n=1 Tax=Pelovirga terrestris TaxID=2771352 RepID=A0A8J6QVW1_9BACT|nr:RidA family protein [Pelovirga terrestris]MBD1399306.1 RidA family protein [Pelovirga terrestris]
MSNKVVSTEAAPAAIGPYSQAIQAGDLLFCSGQIPLDPATGAMIDGGIEEQTRQVMKNLGEVLKAAGAGYGDLVKTTIYLTDLSYFPVVNDIYAGYLGDRPPARATVEVTALPKGALVEIDGIAGLS